mgnify:CR=1 FL=1
MPKRFLGNIMTDSPTAPAGPYKDSAASGVWSLAEALSYTKGGLWPIAGNVNAIALFAGGNSSSNRNVIDSFQIVTTGNATDFGDLLYSGSIGNGSVSSSTRAVHGGGNNVNRDADQLTLLQYSTITSAGNALDFGDFAQASMSRATISNGTRGVWGDDTLNVTSTRMEYITIATLGNSSDFGDSTAARGYAAGASSPTRGVVAGGYLNNGSGQNVIEYITVANTGNTTDFGDLTVGRYYPSACSSNTRACIFGGVPASGVSNTIDYITTASTGNASDFGDLAAANYDGAATSSSTRGVYAGGKQPQSANAEIKYITIASTGNTSAFGNLTVARFGLGGSSNNHGGLAA